jgi:hypothetical protein
MPANYIPTGDEYFRFLPEIILSIVGTLIMVMEPLTSEKNKGILAKISSRAFLPRSGPRWSPSQILATPSRTCLLWMGSAPSSACW